MTLGGVPERWEAGRTYTLAVTLTRPGMSVGGFQMTARFEDGTQAGAFHAGASAEPQVAVAVKADTGVEYVHQTAVGNEASLPGEARWTVLWTAPDANAPAVLFHVAANAADADGSAEGDYVYTSAVASFAMILARNP